MTKRELKDKITLLEDKVLLLETNVNKKDIKIEELRKQNYELSIDNRELTKNIYEKQTPLYEFVDDYKTIRYFKGGTFIEKWRCATGATVYKIYNPSNEQYFKYRTMEEKEVTKHKSNKRNYGK